MNRSKDNTPKENYVRYGDKLIIANGVDPLSYIDLSAKWWQFWKTQRKYYKPKKSESRYIYDVRVEAFDFAPKERKK